MDNQHIGFIGGGNMARSLIGGLLSSGIAKEYLHVTDSNQDKLEQFKADFDINIHPDNQALQDACDVLVFSVKPQILKDVASALKADNQTLYISIAAGITSESLNSWLGGNKAIVRTMPNTPAMVQSGATGLFANAQVSEAQKEIAESILRAVGITVWVDKENQLDAVTALSGSGPAYFFLLMETMEQAAIKLGLPEETARLLAIQTGFGASKLALEIEQDPAILRAQVTSPGGTTEQAINTFIQHNLSNIVEQAMTAARDRAEELAQDLGK